MGVPAFFRWLSRKYPSIVANSIEDQPVEVDGETIPVDISKPNPNGVEFDNLYLDMNGIIHPCCHPEHSAAPKNEDEMMIAIFAYIDRLMAICRPRRLLYMAIDGVAPRAKMNQQRSRRFRSVKEGAEARAELAGIRRGLEEKGVPLPPAKPEGEHFDSNCITPGTPFMAHLAEALRYYVQDRLSNDPAWAKIQVILSDANAPGEGEHKIMDYIRRQRASPSHDPNTKHILCGADADLIMLGLATHEPYFTIIREEFIPHQARPCKLCGQFGHELKDCQGLASDKPEEDEVVAEPVKSVKNFIFIRIYVLREYLAKDLAMNNLPFPFDLERAIDDWVFMCFFVGNDFLPHLPSLEIREGAIDRLIRLYKNAVYKTGGYLTDAGRVSLDRVELIVSELGVAEDEIFKMRQKNELRFRKRKKDQKRRERAATAPGRMLGGDFAPQALGRGRSGPGGVTNPREQAAAYRRGGDPNASAAAGFRQQLGRKRDHSGHPVQDDVSSEEEAPDEVRLYEAGWKERYYQAKFEVSENDFAFRHKVGQSYVEGLLWVLRYYYQGCGSWKWFYPYHYAPFASDLHDVAKMDIKFAANTKPFNPLEQLMGVFPAASMKHLPAPWRPLMTDPESPILDFYPDDFQVDLNGKKFAWMGVALLPFVEEERLLETLETVYPKLKEDEVERNKLARDRVFVSSKHPAYDFFQGILEASSDKWLELEPTSLYGMAGLVKPDPKCAPPGETIVSPIEGAPNLPGNACIGLTYKDPEFPAGHWFSAARLPGAETPETTLKPGDHKGEYRPQIGMSRNVPQAHLGGAGHRMLRHHASIPPPEELQRGRDDYRRRDRDPHRSHSMGGFGGHSQSPRVDRSGFGGPQPLFSAQSSHGQSGGYGGQAGYGGGGGGGGYGNGGYGGQSRYAPQGSSGGGRYGQQQYSNQSGGSWQQGGGDGDRYGQSRGGYSRPAQGFYPQSQQRGAGRGRPNASDYF